MNERSRLSGRLPNNHVASEPSSASDEDPPPHWACPCGAIVALREPACPFCQQAFDPKYEGTARA